jgi:phospholipase C
VTRPLDGGHFSGRSETLATSHKVPYNPLRMRRKITLLILGFLLAVSLFLLNLNGCGSVGVCTPSSGDDNACSQTTTINPPPSKKVEHVVVLFQENRSTDNFFHDPVLMRRGADIASSGLNSKGQTIPLKPIPLGINYDLLHTHPAFVLEYDNGKMDGADQVAAICTSDEPDCAPPDPQYKYVQDPEMEPYFQLAEQYAFGDRMFQTNQGPSFPAHQFIFSGTSAPTASSPFFVAENPDTDLGFEVSGCVAPADETVLLIDSAGKEQGKTYPCFEHPTLSDELDAKHISWGYYTPSSSDDWNAPNAIHHICQPKMSNGEVVCTGEGWNNHVKISQGQVFSDIANNQLPAVSWVIPSGQNSDHPASSSTIGGPSWVASVVNTIGNSPYWANTVIIVTWDDWGGWYDHVPPPKVLANCERWGCGYLYGFRVPLLVISPYAKRGYISHKNHDFGSILKFIEEIYGLPSLGYADAWADDLSDCFDFKQTLQPFPAISAPRDANYFLHDTTPPMVPDND